MAKSAAIEVVLLVMASKSKRKNYKLWDVNSRTNEDTDHKKIEEYVKRRYDSDCAKNASFQDPSAVHCIALDLGCDIVCNWLDSVLHGRWIHKTYLRFPNPGS
jgi:hypothetical protein